MTLRPFTAALFAGAVLIGAAGLLDPLTGSALRPALAAEAAKAALSPEQQKAVRDLVKEYLLKNPEVIVEALRELRRREQEAKRKATRAALAKYRDEIVSDKDAPVGGNPNGNVTIVEFFDYQCGYCKRVMQTVIDSTKQDGNIRLVFKEFPILGPASVIASEAALAARKQGKYEAFHFALMGHKGQLSRDAIMDIAKSVGLDVEKLKDDMNSPEIKAIIVKNHRLARALAIQGTPAFVIGDQLVPGALDRGTLNRLVARARQTCKANNLKVC